MNNLQKIGIILLAAVTFFYVKNAFFPSQEKPNQEIKPQTKTEQIEEEEITEPESISKEYVYIYFIGQNENKQEIYKAVKRVYKKDNKDSKFRFAIKNLIKGPTQLERKQKIYSEIPSQTRLISLIEKNERIIINLSGEFEMGGGTDGLYKRLFQLIKTSNLNTKLPVYLYINGEQAEIIGGEGLMINQPLTERSLD